MRLLFLILGLLLLTTGCAAFPEVRHQDQFHNPFPQLSKVAIVPFNNQSDVPTLNAEQVTISYYGELQKIPGFEVVPVGVVRRVLEATGNELRDANQIRDLGKQLGVDVVVIGAVTDYEPYYPKRATLAIDWYAVNPGFHPIPAGYGLPWGTSQEEFIPESHIREAEYALAKVQLETQTPLTEMGTGLEPSLSADQSQEIEEAETSSEKSSFDSAALNAVGAGPNLPENWPDPRGFIPPGPQQKRPALLAQEKPIISQIRSYNENNSDFAEAAEKYVYFLEDSRIGGWQGYLDRSDDFIRFCCYSHITEMLSLRGGAGKSRVALRWVESR